MFDALPDDVLWQVVNHVDNDDVWVVALGSRSLRKAVRRSHPDGLPAWSVANWLWTVGGLTLMGSSTSPFTTILLMS
jgi:hypothetical protein